MAAIDPGVRAAVALLNAIPGVATNASCEGCGQSRRRRHATFAYVQFRQLLPIDFHDYLLAEIGACARVEEQAAYARGRDWNARFLRALTRAARTYLRRRERSRRAQCRVSAARLRRQLSRADAMPRVWLCLDCGSFPRVPHEGHFHLELRRLTDARRDAWFREFSDEEPNRLPRDLVAAETAARLRERTLRGQFGPAFAARWRTHAAERTAIEALAAARAAVVSARAVPRWAGLDVYVRRGVLVFEWRDAHRRRPKRSAAPHHHR